MLANLFENLDVLFSSQLRRSVRKKHTLPNFKIRHQPFFTKPVNAEEAMEVRVNGTSLGTGRLEVTVQECSRLVQVPQGWAIFCRVSVGKCPSGWGIALSDCFHDFNSLVSCLSVCLNAYDVCVAV